MRIWVLILIVMSMPTGLLANEMKKCNAVDSISVVGHFDFDIVTIHANTDDKTCHFSINGARTGSPPPEEIEQAFNTLFGPPGQFVSFERFSEAPIPELATLLATAGPDVETGELKDLLQESSEALNMCLSASLSNEPVSNVDISDFEAGCFSSSTRSDGEFYSVGPFRSSSTDGLTVPRMSIFVRRESVWNMVSFPVR